jgi:hypothetical protein
MQSAEQFAEELTYDEERNVRIKSTCKRCGESCVANVRDSSLWNWEETHRCGDLPKNVIQFPART